MLYKTANTPQEDDTQVSDDGEVHVEVNAFHQQQQDLNKFLVIMAIAILPCLILSTLTTTHVSNSLINMHAGPNRTTEFNRCEKFCMNVNYTQLDQSKYNVELAWWSVENDTTRRVDMLTTGDLKTRVSLVLGVCVVLFVFYFLVTSVLLVLWIDYSPIEKWRFCQCLY